MTVNIMEKRFFNSFKTDNNDTIKITDIIHKIQNEGFLHDDPRLKDIFHNFKQYPSNTIDYIQFKSCIEKHICIFNKIMTKQLIIPDFPQFTENIKNIYDLTEYDRGGHVADYIPQLKRVNPDQYGISVCTVDGQRYNIGDTNVDFSVQSCCKPINYGIALESLGEEYVHKYVGREPSGQSFNELTLNKEGKPHNPLINSGAIMTSSFIKNDCPLSERFEYITDIWSRLSGGIYKIGFNNPVYLSEKHTADRNYALAYFMKETNDKKKVGFPDNTNIEDTLSLYFQCCSIEVNTQILSIVAATLANGGINPFSGERIWSHNTVKNVLSMMLMCGMYDYSGEFAFKIGIPSKSGVAGAVMLVIPNVMGIVSWSPNLDEIGNSYQGVEFCKLFGQTFNFHIFDNITDNSKYNPIENDYSSNKVLEFTELCMASQKGDLDYIKSLYNSGIDMNQHDYDNRTALHLAVCEKHYDIIKFLIHVCNVDQFIKDRWNNSPFDEALKIGDNDIIQLFDEKQLIGNE